MKTFRTIILITGILAAGLAYNTTFAQESNAVKMDESKPSPEIKHTKDHKHKVKRESKPMAKALALHAARDERRHKAKEVKHEMKTHPKFKMKDIAKVKHR